MSIDVWVCFPQEQNLGSVCSRYGRCRDDGQDGEQAELSVCVPAALPHKHHRASLLEQDFRNQVLGAAHTALRCSSNEKLI